MTGNQNQSHTLKVVSIVEALTVTGPVKPLLMFSHLTRQGVQDRPALVHALMTTRRNVTAGERANDPLSTAASAAGLQFIPVEERHPFDIRVLRKMTAAIRKIAPAIIESHDCKSHLLLFLMRVLHADIRRVTWIAFHHGYTSTSWKVRLYQLLDRLTLRFADRIVTLCQPFALMLSRRGVRPSMIDVVTNSISPRASPSAADIAQSRTALNIAVDECVIITVGRLSVEKGHSDLIAAFAQMLDKGETRRCRLVLVGDGPERARLEALAAALGNRVTFVGHVSDPWPLFHAADIFALPSHSEGSPLVVLEAMAAGLAIIATKVGGVPELLSDGETAILVPPRDQSKFAKSLHALVGDDSLRQKIGIAGLAAAKDFTPNIYARNLFSVYDKAIANQKERGKYHR